MVLFVPETLNSYVVRDHTTDKFPEVVAVEFRGSLFDLESNVIVIATTFHVLICLRAKDMRKRIISRKRWLLPASYVLYVWLAIRSFYVATSTLTL